MDQKTGFFVLRRAREHFRGYSAHGRPLRFLPRGHNSLRADRHAPGRSVAMVRGPDRKLLSDAVRRRDRHDAFRMGQDPLPGCEEARLLLHVPILSPHVHAHNFMGYFFKTALAADPA